MSGHQNLFSPYEAAPPDPATYTVSKKGFAELMGITAGRVSQLIAAGLPVEQNNRIHVARGRDWMDRNIDANRRRLAGNPTNGSSPPVGGFVSPRAERDSAEAEIARLKAHRMADRHLDKRATLRVIEARAKHERDALIGWVNRAAPAIAAATNGDLSIITATLDREVREHLIAMASTKLDLGE